MPKRKRDGSLSNPETASNHILTTRQRRVEYKIAHGQKLLARAFKTAKGFERQKLGRRRKTAGAKSDTKDITRIDAETEALKVCHASTNLRLSIG